MKTYDFYIAGRWRNKERVKSVLDSIRKTGKSAYCFIENEYKGEKVEFIYNSDIEKTMQEIESLPQADDCVRKIFRNDLKAIKNSKMFLLVLPAGISGHIEAGIAYGLGKKCFAIGELEKTETLYSIFSKIFENARDLEGFVKRIRVKAGP